MTHTEIAFEFSEAYVKLKNFYDEISEDIVSTKGPIKTKKYLLNNHVGDITKNINWTWAVNKNSFNIFKKFISPLKSKINTFFGNKFSLIGCSFITLYEKEVKLADFHYDISSQYDRPGITNTLTLIFPLYIEEGMGNLEYKEEGKIEVYQYQKNKIFVWDACKLEHRTQPYSLTEKKKRVLVSMNLATNEEWAEKSVRYSLRYQGFVDLT